MWHYIYLYIHTCICMYICMYVWMDVLPNLAAVVHKNWNILQTNKNWWELSQEHSITAFKRSKNLQEINGSTHVKHV